MRDNKDKVVFLDRDGVINEYPGDAKYVTQWKEFKFIPGSIEAIRKLKENKFKIFVISNQAGMAKGIYSQRDLDTITRKMLQALQKKKATIDGVYYCTHHPDDGCFCRKPQAGLLEKALSDFNIKPDVSFFVGDSVRDVETVRNFNAKFHCSLAMKYFDKAFRSVKSPRGRATLRKAKPCIENPKLAAECAKSVLVLSGREKLSLRDTWEFSPDFIFDNLLLASYYICAHGE